MKKRIGVIGCGQWGPNQIRSFFFHPKADVVRICDLRQERLDAMLGQFPQVQITQDVSEIINASDIDAVIITTPVNSHFELVKSALKANKDVLCEKPLTYSSSEAKELDDLARSNKCILMVGHVFLFNAGINKLKEIIESKECGQTYYLHAKRTNLGPVRQDVNCVYDLASHDISIFNYLLGGRPRVLSAIGQCNLQPNIEDVAFISLEYPNSVIAHIHVSWLDPKKIRQITVVGDKKMAVWDDISQSGPVEIFSKHIEKEKFYKDFGEFQLLAKDGEVVIPHVKNIEPLVAQANHFMECIIERKESLANGNNALEVVQTLEAIEESLSNQRQTLHQNA